MRMFSSGTPASGRPIEREENFIRSEDDLFVPFEMAFRRSGQRIGLEAEKFGIHSDGSPLRYHGPRGVQVIFSELVNRFGWTIEVEIEGGPPIALRRGDSAITLEPGSQLELSSAPHEDVHAIVAEIEQHRQELAALQCVPDLHWLGLGFHPLARREDLDWVPKARYPIMREYLPTRGRFGIDMMCRTATVQANFDFTSERDAMDKLRVALALSPVVQALFANSAVYEGLRHPVKSHRAEVWLDVDPDRTGLLPFAWRTDSCLGDYIRWALSVPMFLIKRNGQVIRNTGQTFEDFLKNGFEGHRATLTDWEMHLNTLFPEARLKRTLEVRSADSVPAHFSAGLPALWAAILYDEAARREVEELLLPLGYENWNRARPAIAAIGLAATVGGRSLRDIALRVLAIADQALARRARRNAAGQDERIYLEPLRAMAEQGQSVGDAVLGDWTPSHPDALTQLFARARY